MKRFRIRQVVRSKDGTARRVVPLDELRVPDCWSIAEALRQAGAVDEGSRVLETWHLCHDLLAHVRKLAEQSEA